MYRWNGAYGEPGSKERGTKTSANGHNKGVMAAYRRFKRQQAEIRQAACTDHGHAREVRENYRVCVGLGHSHEH